MPKMIWLNNVRNKKLLRNLYFSSWQRLTVFFVIMNLILQINPITTIYAYSDSPQLQAIDTSATESVHQNALTSGPQIGNITSNSSTYPNGLIPRYQKYEITFKVDTTATNLQLPFDSVPPPGMTASVGISVDALFTPDNWVTEYKQPAFYYQQFDDQVKSGREWFYPTSDYSWKVRFSPNQTGNWQYKLTARDSERLF